MFYSFTRIRHFPVNCKNLYQWKTMEVWWHSSQVKPWGIRCDHKRKAVDRASIIFLHSLFNLTPPQHAKHKNKRFVENLRIPLEAPWTSSGWVLIGSSSSDGSLTNMEISEANLLGGGAPTDASNVSTTVCIPSLTWPDKQEQESYWRQCVRVVKCWLIGRGSGGGRGGRGLGEDAKREREKGEIENYMAHEGAEGGG